jgi:hypothetical protein
VLPAFMMIALTAIPLMIRTNVFLHGTEIV